VTRRCSSCSSARSGGARQEQLPIREAHLAELESPARHIRRVHVTGPAVGGEDGGSRWQKAIITHWQKIATAPERNTISLRPCLPNRTVWTMVRPMRTLRRTILLLAVATFAAPSGAAARHLDAATRRWHARSRSSTPKLGPLTFDALASGNPALARRGRLVLLLHGSRRTPRPTGRSCRASLPPATTR